MIPYSEYARRIFLPGTHLMLWWSNDGLLKLYFAAEP